MVMSNQIDNLFKKKLESHTVEPSPGAWVKISSSASKKNKAVIWFRAAAALLLLVSAFWLYNNTNDNTSAKIAEVTTNELKTKEPVVVQKEVDEPKNLGENKTAQTPITPAQKTKTPVAQNNEKHKNENMEQPGIDLITEPNESVALMDSNPFQGDPDIEATTIEATTKPIIIVYGLKSYTKKASQVPEIDQPFERKNGLQKVLDVANNIRTGESTLSGLRQAKEDLFALNFKKEDKKNNR